MLGHPEQLEYCQQLAGGAFVPFDGPIDARSEHLTQVVARHPTGRYVIDVRLGAELGVQGEGDLFLLDEEVEGVVGLVGPRSILLDVDQTLEPDLAHTRSHAARLHR